MGLLPLLLLLLRLLLLWLLGLLLLLLFLLLLLLLLLLFLLLGLLLLLLGLLHLLGAWGKLEAALDGGQLTLGNTVLKSAVKRNLVLGVEVGLDGGRDREPAHLCETLEVPM